MRSPPFDKKLVRQAANYAIDKQAIIQKLMGGLGHAGGRPWCSRRPSATTRPSRRTPTTPRRPRSSSPRPATRTAWTSPLHSAFVEFRPVFEAIAQMLTDAGLRTNARMWDPGPAWNKFFQGEGKATHGYYGSWGNYSVFDADAVLHPLYHTEPGGWIGKWYTRVAGLDAADRPGAVDGGPDAAQALLRPDPAA